MTRRPINQKVIPGTADSSGHAPVPVLAAGRLSMFDPNQILFDHACETLPDSLVRRRRVLQALKVKMNPRHPAYAKVSAQLVAIESVAELHAQFRAELQKSLKTSPAANPEAAR